MLYCNLPPQEPLLDALHASVGTPVLPGAEKLPEALYVHIPFCLSRCTYCDFVTYTTLGSSVDRYAEALAAEITAMGALSGSRPALRTLFFGGGTPSQLSPGQVERVLTAVREAYEPSPGLEFTLEANPGDVTRSLLAALRRLGVNRMSFGMQSARASALHLLGRRHSHDETREAVRLAREVGIENVSLDLIYGLPGETLGDWAADVEAALALEPSHLSAYCLSIEAGTKMEAWLRRGLVEPPSADRAADMIEWLADRMVCAGFMRYEISNWARGGPAPDGFPEMACRHNLTYWLNRPYAGAGAGAHGFWAGVRYANVTRVADYVRRLLPNAVTAGVPRMPAAAWVSPVGKDEAAGDTMLLGLRLVGAGVSVGDYLARHGRPAWSKAKIALDRLHRDGLVEWTSGGSKVRLSARGRMVANRVFAEFV
jgi:oxygen-independent coproporphyrinogen-3 oxidase